MQFGICHLSAVPVRENADNLSAMQSQLLYGDCFKIKESRKFWSRVETLNDKFEGWVLNNQFRVVTEDEYASIIENKNICFNGDLVSYVSDESEELIAIPLGANIGFCEIFQHLFEGQQHLIKKSLRNSLVDTAILYLNSPFVLGGKTPFGIDPSGFTQMVYKMHGIMLFRTIEQQATQGYPLSFIEESEPGDLAFFDDKDGVIDHVGMLLQNNYIIHVHGKVRIDRIDHTGIFNTEERMYSHKLRVIKKIIE